MTLQGDSMATTLLLFKHALRSTATWPSQLFALTKMHVWWATNAFTIGWGLFSFFRERARTLTHELCIAGP